MYQISIDEYQDTRLAPTILFITGLICIHETCDNYVSSPGFRHIGRYIILVILIIVRPIILIEALFTYLWITRAKKETHFIILIEAPNDMQDLFKVPRTW